MVEVKTGLEKFVQSPPQELMGLRIGLLCNPASVDRRLVHARFCIDRIAEMKLTALFSPQHGFYSEKQDNMIESEDRLDPALKIPAYSLYGSTRVPTEKMLDAVDLFVVDLQDVGTRVYTFISTMALCMEAAKRRGRKVVVLDRPNPIGGLAVEGSCLDPALRSFVGKYPLPMRHGLTIAELALLFNEHFGIGCDLSVIPMDGWKRWMHFSDTGLPWVAPSPNMPSPASAQVYPGQVLFEGTNVSEGRGTTQPFELFGAPFIEPEAVLERLPEQVLSGVSLRPAAFEPTWNKWTGRLCNGFQIHLLDRSAYRPCRCSTALLAAIRGLYPKRFAWKTPPYEYEYDQMPIDLICGDGRLRQKIEEGAGVTELVDGWDADEAAFEELRKPYLLYE
ncbi:MAG: DUF1343 domain-containing protein [Desulfobacterales bacterium]|nr:DUF1343 domain-containing protein [Desulfobacterales bacterium]